MWREVVAQPQMLVIMLLFVVLVSKQSNYITV